MALKQPTPGLRTLFNKSNGVAKLQITVQPGDSITVPDDVAVQIELARAPMADITDAPFEKPAPAEAEVVVDETKPDPTPEPKPAAKAVRAAKKR